MTFSESAQQVLLGLIEIGVIGSAGKLATVSRTEWKTETVSITSTPIGEIRPVLLGDQAEQAGAFFSIPGGMFVVMFTRKSGRAMAKAFLPGRSSEEVPHLEGETLAEISNIVVHSVINTIADVCDEVLFISAPMVINGKRGDLLKLAGRKFTESDGASAIVANVHLYSIALASDCTIALLLNSVWKERLLKALD